MEWEARPPIDERRGKMCYVLNEAYSFEKIEDNLIGINVEKGKVIVLGDIEQFILEKVLIMSVEELIELAYDKYENNSFVATDIYSFLQSLLKEEVLLEEHINNE